MVDVRTPSEVVYDAAPDIKWVTYYYLQVHFQTYLYVIEETKPKESINKWLIQKSASSDNLKRKSVVKCETTGTN